jgi:hypothetical protein
LPFLFETAFLFLLTGAIRDDSRTKPVLAAAAMTFPILAFVL